MSQSAFKYAKEELKAGKFPIIGFYSVCGEVHLTDAAYHLLSDRPFKTEAQASAARSKIIERATKAVNK